MKEINSETHSCTDSLASLAILTLSGRDLFIILATFAIYKYKMSWLYWTYRNRHLLIVNSQEMSNRIVSDVYNGVIDDVSKNVKYDFEEMGIEDVVLQELIKSQIWHDKLEASNQQPDNKDDLFDSLLSQQQQLQQQSSKSNNNNNNNNDDDDDDNPLGSSDDDKKKGKDADEDAINSDLDDDDDEEDNDLDTNNDIVLCLYDKVQRVKNKWRMQLKDGIISINNKDYLFSKCSGEFEW
ncbi:TFIIA-domain-containing protein [Wallemia mellicola]|uniref:TFIIA-domain-containing protein n=2 Tax=Wallemia mellicola TaxID=1708541 RepID=A0AB74KGC6_9BASI|nr:TFIIA-domain-containing protein [Wallemia mellicola]